MQSRVYRGVTIDHRITGWYSAFILDFGYVKADTLAGIKSLIRERL